MTSLLVARLRPGLPATGLATLMVLLALLNVAVPMSADTLLASAAACDLNAVRGGLNWVGIIDTTCAITDLGAFLGLAPYPYAVAFCVGWNLGRLIGE